MAELKWEQIASNDAVYWSRAEVPGGWIYQAYAAKMSGEIDSLSLLFVPNNTHKVEPKTVSGFKR